MTREEAAKIINECKNKGFKYTLYTKEEYHKALDMAIQALEKEHILDKIKEEIKDNTYFINETTEKEGINFETVEKIIDKYKVERIDIE